MRDNYPAALALVLQSEGGFVDSPKDPGGATNQGVTQATYDRWRKLQGQPLQSVRLISSKEVSSIYKSEYWDAANCDQLPSGVDYCVFDFDVNSGEARAARFLQHVLYLQTDGIVGPKTVATAARANPRQLCFAICLSRLRFMESRGIWEEFGKGWASRVLSVLYQSIRMSSTPPAN